MPDISTQPALNGDTRIIIHRLDQIDQQLVSISDKLDRRVSINDERIRQLEISQAVLVKSQKDCTDHVCGELKELKNKINKNDILGSVLGAVGAWIAAVITYLGFTSGGK